MARKVSNINYKGIAHTPSLVSDNDGSASECINLAPDNGDLKPMPMPVKMPGTYHVEYGSKIIFVHKGVGYESFVELFNIEGDENEKLFLKDQDGRFLYGLDQDNPYWTNHSEIISIQSIGNTLVVSTKAGTEYLLYRNDIAPSVSGEGFSTTSSYKPIGQKPPMPVVEFQMNEDVSVMQEYFDMTALGYSCIRSDNNFYYNLKDQDGIVDVFKSLISSLERRIKNEKKFYEPFYIRYAVKLKTNDYIMHSPPVLLLPSGLKCPIALLLTDTNDLFTFAQATVQPSKLRYKINNAADFSDWSDIVDGIDIFVSSPIHNYDYNVLSGGEVVGNNRVKLEQSTTSNPHDFGFRYVDGIIKQWEHYTAYPYNFLFTVQEYDTIQMSKRITSEVLFHKVSSFEASDLSSVSSDYVDLPIESLENLTNLPTLPDDYNSHNSISSSLMQTYNNRLNMANIRQRVFDGFENAYQQQSTTLGYHFNETIDGHIYNTNVYVDNVYFKVKKNGKTYVAQNQNVGTYKLDYCSYLYYPDADCFEAVIQFRVGVNPSTSMYATMPMNRHAYLNGSYWYSDMRCLGRELAYKYHYGEYSNNQPQVSDDLWYRINNRFMMSSVGNPWHFSVDNMFDIGMGNIMALSVNAESMDAPQFGQNPIYVFSSDGVWTIALNDDGTFRKLSYVSGDVITEPQGLGTSPTASGEQLTFFKTERGIMMMSGSTIKEIDLCMKGRLFNPISMLLPSGSIKNGIPSSGVGPLSDIIDSACDNTPYSVFAKDCNLVYDYANKRLMLYNSNYPYVYVYDLRNDFWSKLFPTTAVDGSYEQEGQEDDKKPEIRIRTVFVSVAMEGSKVVVQDEEGGLWYMGGLADENTISTRSLGFYVSKPMRFGTDEYKTLTNVVHNAQLTKNGFDNSDIIRMALYGSRDGQQYWRIGTLKGTSYKYFVIVLYTCMRPSSRYAYTAFEWEKRLSNKIR